MSPQPSFVHDSGNTISRLEAPDLVGDELTKEFEEEDKWVSL